MNLPVTLPVVSGPSFRNETIVMYVEELSRNCPNTVTIRTTLRRADGLPMDDDNYQIFWRVGNDSVFFTYIGGAVISSSNSAGCTVAPIGSADMWTVKVHSAFFTQPQCADLVAAQGWFGATDFEQFFYDPCPIVPPPPPDVVSPQRTYPRDDGYGIGTKRSWPQRTSRQGSLRRGPVGTYW